jgi:hypothetical protein
MLTSYKTTEEKSRIPESSGMDVCADPIPDPYQNVKNPKNWL